MWTIIKYCKNNIINTIKTNALFLQKAYTWPKWPSRLWHTYN